MKLGAFSGSPTRMDPMTRPLRSLIDDRPAEGVFRVHRDVFRNPDIFELEMRTLFEGGWVFVSHASQLPNAHDFLCTTIGRQPVVVMRDGRMRLGAFINSCRHKGAQIAHHARGNRAVHVCRYHGWAYDSSGRNVAVRGHAEGAYSPAFDEECHDLQPVAAFDAYRGFLFASLKPTPVTLEQHLGDTRLFIDMIVDQSPDGVELVPGVVRYSFDGNWKLQLENSIDAYHFPATHPSYLRLLDRRATMKERTDVPPAVWQGDGGRQVEDLMGSFGFEAGHALVWTTSPIERHPLYPQRAELRARVGAQTTDWMMRTRQFNLFPNLQLASNAALQMRVIRPVAVNRTEMLSYCLAPVGEPPAARTRRLRQYEDFFNPSGLATPDDTVSYEDCQRGFESGEIEWQQGAARGGARPHDGPDSHADALGIRPATALSGPFSFADETVYRALYRAWLRRLAP